MGKSTSCLSIISCAGGSTDPAEAGTVDQTKGSKVSKGWSFKKRSSSGRAVNNSLIVETPSAGINESLESAAINFETPSESTVLEKKSAIQLDEKKPEPFASDLSTIDPVTVSAAEKQPGIVATHVTDNVIVSNNEKQSATSNSDVTDGVTVSKTEENNAVSLVDESVVIIIQSAIRSYLAQKDQIKNKSAVKLQAVVRGHLVRCHAIGALRCIQAIVKMQLLIRDRYVRLPLEEQAIESDKKGDHTKKVRKPAKVKPDVTYTSMNDLLKSSFARQLLESSPKSKRIKIKCDPLRRDSSWVWLERWMSLASPVTVDENVGGIKNGQEENVIENEQEDKISVEDYLFHEENEIFSEADHADSNISAEHSKLTDVEEVNPISNEIANSYHNFSVSSVERQKTDTMRKADTSESAANTDLISFPLNAGMNSPKITSVNENPAELKVEQAIELNYGRGTEQDTKLRPEDYDIVTGSGTESSPSVITVEPIIEHELVSVPDMAISSDSATQDAGVEELLSVPIAANIDDDAVPQKSAVEELGSTNIYEDAVTPKCVVEEPLSVPNSVHMIDSVPLNTEAGEPINHNAEFDLNIGTATSSGDDTVINLKEPSEFNPSSIQGGGPECSTENSVTSTVDSPDSVKIRPVGVESEKTDARDIESHIPEESNIVKVETESKSSTEDTKQSNSGESAENATVVDTGKEEKDIKTDTSNLPVQLEAGEKNELEASISDLTSELGRESKSPRSHQASPGASPRSTVTVTESQGTPSSQGSVPTKPKSAKTEKSGSIKKRTILSTAKKSPSNSTSNSGGKNSAEQLHKDQKSLKKRTSFSSPKPDIADAEQQKESSSSSSLPSYMQATESARAKANAGHLLRSSPDVADKDVFIRKRQSLSGAKDKQESPRLQRASSQAQSGSKSNGTSPSEKKWHR